jgi:hypothetical protein
MQSRAREMAAATRKERASDGKDENGFLDNSAQRLAVRSPTKLFVVPLLIILARTGVRHQHVAEAGVINIYIERNMYIHTQYILIYLVASRI